MIKPPFITRDEFEVATNKLGRRIDSRGPMTPPIFRAYRNGALSVTSASTEVLIALNAETEDNFNAFNTATYLWTCPRAGVYQFNSGIRLINGSGVAADIYMRLRINGAAGTIFLHPMQEMAVANGALVLRHGSALYRFAAGNTVGMYVYTTQQPLTVGSVLSLCFMGAYFVST